MSDHDPVEKPKHYNAGKIEVLDFIEDQGLGYHLGNVIKYICRSAHKGEQLQDLKKAIQYLRRYIWLLERAAGITTSGFRWKDGINETEKA